MSDHIISGAITIKNLTLRLVNSSVMVLKIFVVIALLLLIAGMAFYFLKGSSFFSKHSSPPSVSSLTTTKITSSLINSSSQSITAVLKAPHQSSPSGYVRFSDVAGNMLIQLKSDSPNDHLAIIYSGNCSVEGKILYPLALLQEGKSQSVWENDFSALKTIAPLSVRVFTDAKNLSAYSRCGEIERI